MIAKFWVIFRRKKIFDFPNKIKAKFGILEHVFLASLVDCIKMKKFLLKKLSQFHSK